MDIMTMQFIFHMDIMTMQFIFHMDILSMRIEPCDVNARMIWRVFFFDYVFSFNKQIQCSLYHPL